MNERELQELYNNHDLKYYTPSEEFWNSFTHALGSVLAVAGLVFMLIIAEGWREVLASVMFFLPCFLVYSNSAVYHALKNLKIKRVWRRLDHASIPFIVIACGNPLCLCLSDKVYNFVALGITFTIGASIVFMCLYDLMRFKRYCVFLDFVIGGVLGVVYLINREFIPSNVEYMFLAGTLLCVSGTILYGVHTRFAHTVFHVLELVGTMVFYFGAYNLMTL